jgi:small multidrug resistance pump
MSAWPLLAAAIVTEVTATVSLKLSDGFGRVAPSVVVVVGYLLSFYLLARVLAAGMSLGVVYAIWSAIGVALVVIVDVVWFDQRLSLLQVAGLFLVVVGVLALELGGGAEETA